MEEYLINFIFENYNKELLAYLLPIGYLSFLLYFYGDKWTDFSDFDKIAFTLLSCYIILNFLIVPVTISVSLLYHFFVFTNEANLISPVQTVGTYNLSLTILLIVLTTLRLVCKVPLHKSKHAQYIFFTFIIYSMTILFSIHSYLHILSIIYGYPYYYEYLRIYLVQSIAQLFFILLIIYHLFNEFFEYKIDILEIRAKERLAAFKSLPIKVSSIKVGAVVIIFCLAILFGGFLFTPTITETEQNIISIKIDELNVFNMPKYVSAERRVYENYIINPPIALNWVKVTSNLDLKEAYTKIDGIEKGYYIKDNYFIVNESSKTNITTIGYDIINISTEAFVISRTLPKYEADIEYFRIILKNDIASKIYIGDIDLFVDSNYEAVRLTADYGTYSNTWTKNDSAFGNLATMMSNSLLIDCPDLSLNKSVELSVVLEKINYTN